MKIAMIGQKGIAVGAGGVEKHVEKLALGLVKNNENVTVYYRNTYESRESYEYKGIRLKRISTLNLKSVNAVIYAFKATISALYEGFDIYHFHAVGPALFSFIPKIFGRKVIVTIHGLDWQRQKWGILAKAVLKIGEMVAARNADVVISVSEKIKTYLIEKYKNRNESNTVFIPNGVDIEQKLEPALIKKYNLEKDGYILFLGRIVPEKGIHYLIEAYKEINTGKKLVIAGGSSYTDEYFTRIKEMAQDNKNIIFTGHVYGDMLKELYSNCLFYILPSDIEGMPLSLLEALSYGKYCLVSDIDENRYVINSDIMGKSFKKSDINDLKDKLTEIIDNRLYVNGEKERNNIIQEEYNWDNVVKATDKVYKSAVCNTELITNEKI